MTWKPPCDTSTSPTAIYLISKPTWRFGLGTKSETRRGEKLSSITELAVILGQNVMTKLRLQIAIGIVGIMSTLVGIWTMLQIQTMFLSTWFLVGLYLTIALLLSLVVGWLTKKLLKSGWYTLTFTALITTAICLSFYISQYKPYYKYYNSGRL